MIPEQLAHISSRTPESSQPTNHLGGRERRESHDGQEKFGDAYFAAQQTETAGQLGKREAKHSSEVEIVDQKANNLADVELRKAMVGKSGLSDKLKDGFLTMSEPRGESSGEDFISGGSGDGDTGDSGASVDRALAVWRKMTASENGSSSLNIANSEDKLGEPLGGSFVDVVKSTGMKLSSPIAESRSGGETTDVPSQKIAVIDGPLTVGDLDVRVGLDGTDTSSLKPLGQLEGAEAVPLAELALSTGPRHLASDQRVLAATEPSGAVQSQSGELLRNSALTKNDIQVTAAKGSGGGIQDALSMVGDASVGDREAGDLEARRESDFSQKRAKVSASQLDQLQIKTTIPAGPTNSTAQSNSSMLELGLDSMNGEARVSQTGGSLFTTGSEGVASVSSAFQGQSIQHSALQLAPNVNIRRVTDFQVSTTDASDVFEVTLKPEELGRFSIKLDTQGTSTLVTVFAERAETQDLIKRHAAMLEENLQNMGFENLSFEFTENGPGGDQSPVSDSRPSDPMQSDDEAPVTVVSGVVQTDGLDIKV